MVYSKDRQSELAELAKSGDTSAMSALVGELSKMVQRKAKQYAEKSACEYDDLVQEAWAKLPIAVQTYDRSRASFFHHFCCLAFRHTSKIAKSTLVNRQVHDLPLDDFSGRVEAESHDAQEWLSHLSGVQRFVVERRSGYRGTCSPLTVLAAELGVTVLRVKQIEQQGYKILRSKLT